MKRLLSLLLAAVLCLTALAGCGSSDDEEEASPAPDGTVNSVQANSGSDADGSVTELTPEAAKSSVLNRFTLFGSSFEGRSDISYVMIYNPAIYDETRSYNSTVSTGDFGRWLDAYSTRSGGLDDGADSTEPDDAEEPAYITLSQGELMKEMQDLDIDYSQSRASVLLPEYNVGDRHDFYYLSPSGYSSTKGSFECVYEGDHCYMWLVQGQSSDRSKAVEIAEEFDSKIYDKDVEMFGTPRFADEGGKISLLFHPMQSGLLGYFMPKELHTTAEISSYEAERSGVNLNHAIVHINSDTISRFSKNLVCGTLAHEFQHLINFSSSFYTPDNAIIPTWLNESMSGYAEETQYHGVKIEEGHYEAFATSDRLRKGQSLYNFDTSYFDIGVYGSVYLFSAYINNLAGDSIYRKTQDYWRESGVKGLDAAKALYHACGPTVDRIIDAEFNYPDSIGFDSDEQAWLSKLTLSFYLSLLRYDSSDPKNYRYVQAQTLLYNSVDPASIEGGGRVIAATKNGQFEIPDNAGKPLVYIGFDKNFNQITDVVYR